LWTTTTTTNLTFNKNTANIVLSNTSTSARTFDGGGLTFNKLTIGGATGTSTLTINGVNTFSELASTKTVAHTVSLGANQTVETWSITGTVGNIVTVTSNDPVNIGPRILTKSGGGFLTGVDYLTIRGLTGTPISDTWYVGSNSIYTATAPNLASGFLFTQRADNVVIVLASGTSFTVPADWNNSNNEIHLFSGGGGGAGGRASGNNRAGGGAGGGGGYTKVTNVTLSGTISYAIGAAGSNGAAGVDGVSGGNTTFNSGAYTTVGGGGGQAATTPTSTGGVAGTGSTFNGGVGGAGSISTAASTGNGGGGGAGAGGPNGAGGNGGAGFASTTTAQVAGGGGGGNGGGTAGGNASSATGGTGGNNSLGSGGGASNTQGITGGGAGGSTGFGFRIGGYGVEIFGSGSGGGGGGANANTLNHTGGLYGGGGGGGGVSTGGGTAAGSAGTQGVIIIVYSAGAAPASNSNFFLMFG
jgi:hypothetical protein